MISKPIIAALASASLFYAGCSRPAEKKEEAPKDVATAAPASFTLAESALHTDIKLPSELTAYREVDIYAKVNSYIKTLSVDVGSVVKEGQLLATLEAPELMSQLAAAESKYKSQQAIYESTNATYQRILDASKTPGTISKNDVDVALAKRNSDLAQMEAARADYRASKTIAEYLTIRAPFDGVISARNVNLGAYIGPSGKGSELPIFSLKQQHHLRLVIEIPESLKNLIKLDDIVKFTVRAFPDQVFSGKIARRAGVMDKRLRSEHIELDVNNNDLRLSPGMIAEASIDLNTETKAFVVPKGAVVNSTEGLFLVEDSNGVARRVPVRVGRVTDSVAEVFGGNLSPGRKFVSKASEEMHNGSRL